MTLNYKSVLKLLIFGWLALFPQASWATFEAKTSFNFSALLTQTNAESLDLYNSFVWMGENWGVGFFVAGESSNAVQSDLSGGGVLHCGHDLYGELWAGALGRTFTGYSQSLSGYGYEVDGLVGKKFSGHFGIDILLSAKRIASGGLDPRWVGIILPMFSWRLEF